MRLQGRPVVQMSHSVAKLWVHSPGSTNMVVEEGSEQDALPQAQAAAEGVRRTMLTQFLEKCAQPETLEDIRRGGYVEGPFANELLYEEFPRYYRWDKGAKEWIRRKADIAEANFIARLGSVNPRNAELTALRILLQNIRGK